MTIENFQSALKWHIYKSTRVQRSDSMEDDRDYDHAERVSNTAAEGIAARWKRTSPEQRAEAIRKLKADPNFFILSPPTA